MGAIPTAVLSERLSQAIRGRRVRAAVFTTFRFEPDFFEADILPLLFDQSFSHVEKVRRVQLEQALRGVEDVAVYYDASGLVAAGGPARLDVRRIPTRRATGCFHPKLIALLVESEPDADDEVAVRSLVLAVTSANLTRAGWWENVEAAHLCEIEAGASSSLRRDLLDLFRRIRRDEPTGDDHAALEAVRSFLLRDVAEETRASRRGLLHPRLFHGQSPLAEFLHDVLRPPFDDYHLEVIAPYLDADAEAAVLRRLVERLEPRSTRVVLPCAPDGTALCSEGFHAAVERLPRTRWAKLPRSVVQRSSSAGDDQPERFTHAKVYRLWSKKEGREFLLVGSPNLTTAGHGRGRAGNLEAAVLVEVGEGRHLGAWLQPLTEDERPTRFDADRAAESGEQTHVPPLVLRHLWASERTEAFWDADEPSPALALESRGTPLGTVRELPSRQWHALPTETSERIAELLVSTCYIDVRIHGDDGQPATILVREEEMTHAPSLLLTLSVEEILEYWSLLSPEQREAFIEQKIEALLIARGELPERLQSLRSRESLFDRFAGIFHAFARLEEHVRASLADERPREAAYRLFSRQPDSLRVLLAKVLGDDSEPSGAAAKEGDGAVPAVGDSGVQGDSGPADGDPGGDLVNRYVTLLTARQLVDRLEADHREFFGSHADDLRSLRELLSRTGEVTSAFAFGDDAERAAFLAWLEPAFLEPAAVPRDRP